MTAPSLDDSDDVDDVDNSTGDDGFDDPVTADFMTALVVDRHVAVVVVVVVRLDVVVVGFVVVATEDVDCNGVVGVGKSVVVVLLIPKMHQRQRPETVLQQMLSFLVHSFNQSLSLQKHVIR